MAGANKLKRIFLGFILGMLLSAPPLWALRVSRPPEFSTWDTNTFSQLNQTLFDFWLILNGRYTLDRVTSDPDGSRRCSVGEMVYYDTSTDRVCICADEATKKWNCWDAT